MTGRTWPTYDRGALPGPTPGQRPPLTTKGRAAAFKNKCGWQTPPWGPGLVPPNTRFESLSTIGYVIEGGYVTHKPGNIGQLWIIGFLAPIISVLEKYPETPMVINRNGYFEKLHF